MAPTVQKAVVIQQDNSVALREIARSQTRPRRNPDQGCAVAQVLNIKPRPGPSSVRIPTLDRMTGLR